MPASTDVSAAAVMTARIAACTHPAIGTPKTSFMPELICSAPRPVETARPKTVETTAMMSMAWPMGPWMRSPSSGWNADDTRGGRLRLYVKYPKHRPGTTRMAHMWMPKWKFAIDSASHAASSE